MTLMTAFDKNSNRLAEAIRFVFISRQLRIPTLLQYRILRCVGGLAHLAKINIKYLLDIYDYFPSKCRPNCPYRSGSNSCIELSARECSFIVHHRIDLIATWQNINLRNKAYDLAEHSQHNQIAACDITDLSFPNNLKQISGCPAILFYRGSSLKLLNHASLNVTIVGTRAPTPYGLSATRYIVETLAAYDCTIISGLAKGIDALSHQVALEQCAFTVAVTATGPDYCYPPQNKSLQEEIADRGLVLSEHPPGTRPIRQFFPARNRILSGLAEVIIVTESPNKSGTLVTASFAADQGRDVFAVPGNILQKTGTGCNKLIIDGATLLDDPLQIIEKYQPYLRKANKRPQEESSSSNDDQKESAKSQDNLSEKQKLILHYLQEQALNTDQLASRSEIAFNTLTVALSELEIKGLIKRERGRFFLTYKKI